MPINNLTMQFANQPGFIRESINNRLTDKMNRLKVADMAMSVQAKQDAINQQSQIQTALQQLESDPKKAMQVIMRVDPDRALKMQEFNQNASEQQRKSAEDKARQMYSLYSGLMMQYQTPEAFNQSPIAQQEGLTWDHLMRGATESAAMLGTFDLSKERLEREKFNETKRHNQATEQAAKDKATVDADDWQMKPGDSSEIRRQIDSVLSGGNTDIYGNYIIKDNEQRAQSSAILKRASQIYRQSKGRTSHAEAANIAMQEAGIDTSELAGGGLPPASAGQPQVRRFNPATGMLE